MNQQRWGRIWMILYILTTEVKKGQDQKWNLIIDEILCFFTSFKHSIHKNRKHHEITASIYKKKLHNCYSAEHAPCALLLSPERPVTFYSFWFIDLQKKLSIGDWLQELMRRGFWFWSPMFSSDKVQLIQAYSYCHINSSVFSESCLLCKVMLALTFYFEEEFGHMALSTAVLIMWQFGFLKLTHTPSTMKIKFRLLSIIYLSINVWIKNAYMMLLHLLAHLLCAKSEVRFSLRAGSNHVLIMIMHKVTKLRLPRQ